MSQNNDTFVIRDRRPGYLRVYNDLYDRFGAQMGPYGLAVYVALCRYANQDSECWPSYNTIAKGTGMSRRKVIYEIKRMEELHIIAIERNQHSSNVFVLLDTSAQHAPKQSSNNKVTHRSSNKVKEGRKNYRPDDLRDIILG